MTVELGEPRTAAVETAPTLAPGRRAGDPGRRRRRPAALEVAAEAAFDEAEPPAPASRGSVTLYVTTKTATLLPF